MAASLHSLTRALAEGFLLWASGLSGYPMASDEPTAGEVR